MVISWQAGYYLQTQSNSLGDRDTHGIFRRTTNTNESMSSWQHKQTFKLANLLPRFFARLHKQILGNIFFSRTHLAGASVHHWLIEEEFTTKWLQAPWAETTRLGGNNKAQSRHALEAGALNLVPWILLLATMAIAKHVRWKGCASSYMCKLMQTC